MGLSVWQILIIVLVVVLLFGAGKIPRLAKDLGSGVTAFKRGLKGAEESTGEEENEVEEAKPALKSAETAQAKKPAAKKKAPAQKKTAEG
ncbi:MAG: twin-arginine translocase TatA/TatE family subunit [Pseudomonadota bacterium]